MRGRVRWMISVVSSSVRCRRDRGGFRSRGLNEWVLGAASAAWSGKIGRGFACLGLGAFDGCDQRAKKKDMNRSSSF